MALFAKLGHDEGAATRTVPVASPLTLHAQTCVALINQMLRGEVALTVQVHQANTGIPTLDSLSPSLSPSLFPVLAERRYLTRSGPKEAIK